LIAIVHRFYTLTLRYINVLIFGRKPLTSRTITNTDFVMSVYEEVEIEDMLYNEDDYSYTYPCPCGDKFRITLEELWDGEDIAKCPSCTLRIMVIYDEADLPPLPSDDESDAELEAICDKLQKVTVKH